MFSRGKQLVEMSLKRCTENSKVDFNNNEQLFSDYSSSEHDDDVKDPDFFPEKKKRKLAKRVDKIIHCVTRNTEAENSGLKLLPQSCNLLCNETLSSDSSSGNEESGDSYIDSDTLPNKVMNLDHLEQSESMGTQCAGNQEHPVTQSQGQAESNPIELFKSQEHAHASPVAPTTLGANSDSEIQAETERNSYISLDETPDTEGLVVDHEEVIEGDSTDQLRKNIESSTNVTKVKNKLLRMTGLKYKGVVKDAEGKKHYSAERSERILAPSKCSKRCDKQIGGRKCMEIDSKTREDIFKLFWQTLCWKQKKVYVLGLVDIVDVKRRVGTVLSPEERRKKVSYKYFLKVDNERVQVCRNMFLSTLGLNEKVVYQWVQTGVSGIPRNVNIEGLQHPSGRGGTISEAMVQARQYLSDLPKLPSHYCRVSTSKLYLEPVFGSVRDVHNEYTRKLTEESKPVLKLTQFTKLFNDMNLSLYRPKKDLCDICCGHEVNNVSDTDYAEHIKRKDDARNEKDRDKIRAQTERNVKVLTVDLQSLLICPKLNASSIYYKMKLSCHNYTIFDLETRKVMCYFWHECDGELTANVFTTCLIDYLSSLDLHETNHVIIYSDGCGYQNRNVTLANALLQFACDHNITIEQKILERGHTQMECDSVHSVIERSIKDKPIYVPEQYVEKIRNARKVMRYDVKYVDFSFFKDYSQCGKYSSIRPGTGVGSDTVSDLRSLKYSEAGVIMYKTMYGSEYKELPTPRKSLDRENVRPALYTKPLPLKRTKFNHLQQLKEVVPKDYHGFYDSLPHF